jgi:two-component system response regulator FixJ
MQTATSHDIVNVIDDDAEGRESVIALVRAHGVEAEGYESAEDFLASFDHLHSGCLVVDVRMPGMSGVDLQQQLTKNGHTLPIVIITGYADVPTAVEAMRNGALTYLEKPCSDQTLWEAISRGLEIEAASRTRRLQHANIIGCLKTLTAAEHAVLDKLLLGAPNKIIARDLDLGLRTVELRRATILEKMHASSPVELVRMAMQVNLIAPTPQRAWFDNYPSSTTTEIASLSLDK